MQTHPCYLHEIVMVSIFSLKDIFLFVCGIWLVAFKIVAAGCLIKWNFNVAHMNYEENTCLVIG